MNFSTNEKMLNLFWPMRKFWIYFDQWENAEFISTNGKMLNLFQPMGKFWIYLLFRQAHKKLIFSGSVSPNWFFSIDLRRWLPSSSTHVIRSDLSTLFLGENVRRSRRRAFFWIFYSYQQWFSFSNHFNNFQLRVF